MRIVSLLPSATEILCALGLAESLVGISHECDYPPEIRNRPRVTRCLLPAGLTSAEIHRGVQQEAARGESLYALDREKLAALAPDLVVAQRQCSVCAVGESDAARDLQAIGNQARLVSLGASHFEQLPGDIRLLGLTTGQLERAEALLREHETRLERARRGTKAKHRPCVLCVSWFDPLMAAGHWMTQMVELAGGEDRLGRRGGSSTLLSCAVVEAYKPEVVLLLPCGFTAQQTMAEWESARRQTFWAGLPAVEARRVFILEGSLFHRPGPRMVEGVELLASLLHPETSAQLTPGARARQVA